MKYLLLDIDGVFHPYLAFDLEERGFVIYRNRWITWAIDLVHHASWVRDVEDKVSIVWASSWLKDSNYLGVMFGLEDVDLPYIPFDKAPDDETKTWKLESVQKWVQENTNKGDVIVWFDDEIKQDAVTWAEGTSNVKIIITDPAIGVTEKQWQEGLDYLNILS